jgi:3-dehydroquinate synthase
MAEVIKYGVILNPELFSLLETHLSAILRLDSYLLIEIIKICCQLKGLVVEEDETEGDYRAILNFGHTLGHAIETATNYKQFLQAKLLRSAWPPLHLSQKRNFCDAKVNKICRLLKTGLPMAIPKDLKGEPLLRGMAAISCWRKD